MLRRAYSVMTVKALVEESDHWRITGIASTPTTDRMGDVVEPLGATFAAEVPLLWQHSASLPVGINKFGKPTKKGIPFEARIPKVSEPGVLKDRIDEAIQSIKYRLVAAVSIGFRVLNNAIESLASGGLRFLETELMELSLVTIPANPDATITGVKSFDAQLRAALGNKRQGVVLIPAGVSATQSIKQVLNSNLLPLEGAEMKTIADQIKDLANMRAAKAATMAELVQKSADEGRSMHDDEAESFDTLDGEVKQIDADLVRLRRLETLQATTARPVETVGGQKAATGSREIGAPAILVQKTDSAEKFKGQNYTRMVIARALSYLTQESPVAIAQKRWGKSNPQLVELIKTAVAGGGSDSGEWGAELVALDGRYTGDFIEFLYAQTVYNQLPLREVPANITIKGQDGAATGYWVGQSKAIPVSKPDFSTVNLTPLKVAALAVVSNELLRDSSPAAEQLVRDSLVEAASQRIDTTFLSATAASAGVSPAGLLNGVSGIGSAGADGAGLRADIAALYAPFITAKNAGGLQLVTNKSLAKAISLMVNALSQTEFPGLGTEGGTLLGDKVVTGDNVGATHLILLKPSDIYRIANGTVEVSISREAMIEQNDAPQGASDTPVAASATLMSMFQTESTAIKVVTPINFAKRRASAVQFITDAAYSAAGSP